jgi:acetaldehyde dehydrogenase
MNDKVKVAIIGPGNIGTDLMIKVMRNSRHLQMGAMVGVDPKSDGLARAARMDVATTAEGIDGLLKLDVFKDIDIVFDANIGQCTQTSQRVVAGARRAGDRPDTHCDRPVRDPCDHLEEENANNMNMVTCGGQATIPMVAAVSRVAKVHYAEIVASISSKSAGLGTRANIDEFTETTRNAIVKLGGATRGKAIIVLNPAEPPLIMRDTVFVLSEPADQGAIRASIAEIVASVQAYVPGYRLKQTVQFDVISPDKPLNVQGLGLSTASKLLCSSKWKGPRIICPRMRAISTS